jgi:acyl-CoA thioester hydrolase
VARLEADRRDQYPRFVEITTRWMDNDLYNHVNNAVYNSFFDTAVNAFLIGEGLLDIARGRTAFLAVDTAVQFFRPLSFPDRVQCGLRVTHIGTSSVRFEIAVFANAEDTAAAQGHFVHVACDRVTLKPVAMPAATRAVFEKLKAA